MNHFPVKLFEEHSSVLPAWWQTGRRGMDVVYLDAHLDLQQLDQFKIDRLLNCSSVEDFKALESPHYLNPSEKYSYGIENFLFPAAKLGILKHLYWVAPPHIPRAYSEAMLQHTQKMDGVDFAALTGFQQVGSSSISGNLLGIDITICHYDDLQNLDINPDYILDIDIDYFVSVPADRIWIDPGTVLTSILRDLGSPVLATVSHAVTSGFTPPIARFIGQYAESVLCGKEADIAHFQSICRATMLAQNGRVKDALLATSALAASRPECAATHYLLGALLENQTEKEQHLNQAIEIDPIYAGSPLRDASAVPNRFKPLSEPGLNAILRKFSLLSPQSEDYQATHTAIGLLLAKMGKLKEALAVLRTLDAEFEGHFDLAMALGIILSRTDHLELAEKLLTRSSERDKNRTESCFHLGEIAIRKNKLSDAITQLERAHQRAPAWDEPLVRLGACYLRTGDMERKRLVDQKLHQRNQTLQSLLRA